MSTIVNKDYLDEKFNHLNTKLEHIIEEQVRERIERRQLAKETEVVRFLTKHKGLFVTALIGFTTLATFGGWSNMIKILIK